MPTEFLGSHMHEITGESSMNVRVTNTGIRWLIFVGVFAASCGLLFAASRHAVAQHWEGSSIPDLWLRAANLEPSDAGAWYQLGRYRELDFEHDNLPLAISYYQRATALEPISAQYWMDLAGAYETAGNSVAAEEGYRTAQRDYPISGEVAWRYGNFLLRQNRLDDAFGQIQRAVSVNPKLTALAVSRCWRSTHDVDLILKSALPPQPAAYWGAIEFFISARQPGAAMAAWMKLASEHASFPLSEASPLFDLLIQSGDVADAQTVWKQALSAAGATPPPAAAGTLIWDGGFEQDLLNAGFSWHYTPIQGADLEWDEQTVHSGSRSLSVAFDGTANLDFQQIWQYVAVEPGTSYRFSAYIRTQDLNTNSGIHFEIHDVEHLEIAPASTPTVVGTEPWELNDVTFTTSPQTRLLRVVLRRNQSNIPDNRIRGTVWVDDVSLIPVALSHPGTR